MSSTPLPTFIEDDSKQHNLGAVPLSLIYGVTSATIWLLASIPSLTHLSSEQKGLLLWFVPLVVGIASFFLLLIGPMWILSRKGAMPRRGVGLWITLATIASSTVAHYVLSSLTQPRPLEADTLIVRVVLLLVVYRFSVKIHNFLGELALANSALVELADKRNRIREEQQTLEENFAKRLQGIKNTVIEIFSGSKVEISRLLWELSETVVRPISHELSRSSAKFELPKLRIRRQDWRNAMELLVEMSPLRPLLTGIATAILGIGFSIQITTDQSMILPDGSPELRLVVDGDSLIAFALQLVTLSISSYVSVLFAQFVLKRLPKNRVHQGTEINLLLALALGTLTSALSSYLVLLLIQGHGVALGLALICGLSVAIFGLITSTSTAIGALGRALLSSLDSKNHILRREAVRESQELWSRRRDSSLLLHGPIRSLLISQAISHKESPEKSMNASEILDEFDRKQWRFAIDVTKEPMAGIEEVISLWSDNCEINLNADTAELSRISKTPTLGKLLKEMLTEAILNSVVHGKASKIDIQIELRDSDIDFQVWDNGTLTESDRPGLGSSLYSENCTEWSLSHSNEGTFLHAVIPA
jgi:signal transduction histidine kinase